LNKTILESVRSSARSSNEELNSRIEEKNWRAQIAPFRNPAPWRSIWQLTNTLIPFLLIWYVMYLSLNYSYWLTLALAPLAAGFQLRLFMIFHDCCHLAFFKSHKTNAIIGSICGFFCFTPYYHWRYYHALHHATTGNLTKRLEGEIVPLTIPKYMQTNGDVLTLTVKEYLQLSGRQRFTYRMYRWLLLFLIFMPLVIFLVMHRLANSRADKRARYSVYGTNLALAVVTLILSLTIGFFPVLLIELPVLALSATVGVWLFYIQHQFEETYWEESGEWSYLKAALQGSSFYKLPAVLQWFTGNIGYHHIHHLNPRIPNYNLQKCHESSQLFRKTKALTLRTGLKSIFFRLWDEDRQKMVSFASISVKDLHKDILTVQLVTKSLDEAG
jgi:acyl-lipid omega-6 desaturase (Delta-12 desaturase)